VPPLRERREDILPLARRFLEEIAHETNRRVSGFSPAAEEALLAYAWPGNVRELRNVVERSLLLRRSGDLVDVEPLTESPLHAVRSAPTPVLPARPLPDAVEEYERGVILESLRRHQGVVAKAAEALGISRTNLHNKLRKHGLERSQSWDDTRHS
jgi:DNA-binding NtrC family response regulator